MPHRTKAALEERRHYRYKLKVPVIFSWQDAKQGPRQAMGLTRDIGIEGAFVVTASPPPQGANVRLKFVLPTVPHATRTLQLRGQGRVIRVEPAQANEIKGGFEVEGKHFVLRSMEK